MKAQGADKKVYTRDFDHEFILDYTRTNHQVYGNSLARSMVGLYAIYNVYSIYRGPNR